MKSLNCIVYEYILIKRVIEEVKRMLTVINVNRIFTQSLTLILLHFIEAARTSLLNMFSDILYLINFIKYYLSVVYNFFLYFKKRAFQASFIMILFVR